MPRHRTRYRIRAISPVISRITGALIIVSYDRILVGTPAAARAHKYTYSGLLLRVAASTRCDTFTRSPKPNPPPSTHN